MLVKADGEAAVGRQERLLHAIAMVHVDVDVQNTVVVPVAHQAGGQSKTGWQGGPAHCVGTSVARGVDLEHTEVVPVPPQ
eukprot:349715-Chlamydomonas_euryale.AAC.10